MRGYCVLVALVFASRLAAEPLPGTKALTAEGDLAARMVAGIDKYLMRELAASVEKRKQYWKPDFTSPEAYTKSVQPNRERLKQILGVVDARVPVEMQYVATTGRSSLVAETDRYKVYLVRWPVFEGVDGEGLLLEPKDKPVACVVTIPDADQLPEKLVGLAPFSPTRSHFARHLAEKGCRVLVPVLIDRKDEYSGNGKLNRWTNQPHREFIYRMAYQMGRHIIGYEVQKVLAAVDWLTQEKNHPPVGVYGYGEGGLIALISGAIDTRIHTTVAGGVYRSVLDPADDPIYRNVWGLLREFDAQEIASLIAPRRLIVELSPAPTVTGPPSPRAGRAGAAPGGLAETFSKKNRDELTPLLAIWAKLEKRDPPDRCQISIAEAGWYGFSGPRLWASLLERSYKEEVVENLHTPVAIPGIDTSVIRHKRQFDQLVAFTQKLMRDSEQRRAESFWAKIDTSSPEKFAKSTEPFRKHLHEEIIGKLPAPTEPLNARTRLVHDTPKWKSYEVTLDLYPDVFAYGILCVPKDLKPGEKRPVVVCQHGLEGRPQDVVNPKEKTRAYHSFGSQLADRGYIVYAPQNPYIGKDDFRVLQRKANPLGLSLFSFIIAQHERTLDWLAAQPFVDPERMAFYGLSYGGKTAMRVPAVLPRYCLSICSGDFNEWTWKNVSLDFRGSYMFTGEYEMPEFNMGQTLVYAEMAALIAPRPFMVERGHDDGVGIDEWVAYEYAKVRRLYSRLKLPERTEVEFFAGGHVINGQGTFAFLDKHLKWQPK